ncbi:hypothetical protein [Desulfococcus sp.]|uniref:hypothetical protein n=1 Tax=Desulfococcus sp. TaxID=2025834 RepID=UPI0035937F93
MANRKPSKILELSGAYRKNPSRKRPNEPQPTEQLGEPPAHLDRETAAVWVELVQIVPPGVLWASDRICVEIAACLLVEYRRRPADFMASRLAQLRGCLGSLGLSPADRGKLSVPDKKKTDDPWAGFDPKK